MIDGCAEAKTRNGIIIVWNRIFVSCEVCIIYHLPHTEYTSICHNGCWIPNTFLSKFIWKVLDAQSKSVLEHLVMKYFLVERTTTWIYESPGPVVGVIVARGMIVACASGQKPP